MFYVVFLPTPQRQSNSSKEAVLIFIILLSGEIVFFVVVSNIDEDFTFVLLINSWYLSGLYLLFHRLLN